MSVGAKYKSPGSWYSGMFDAPPASLSVKGSIELFTWVVSEDTVLVKVPKLAFVVSSDVCGAFKVKLVFIASKYYQVPLQERC